MRNYPEVNASLGRGWDVRPPWVHTTHICIYMSLPLTRLFVCRLQQRRDHQQRVQLCRLLQWIFCHRVWGKTWPGPRHRPSTGTLRQISDAHRNVRYYPRSLYSNRYLIIGLNIFIAGPVVRGSGGAQLRQWEVHHVRPRPRHQGEAEAGGGWGHRPEAGEVSRARGQHQGGRGEGDSQADPVPGPPPPLLGASSAAASAKENSGSIPGITVAHKVLDARDAVIVTGG